MNFSWIPCTLLLALALPSGASAQQEGPDALSRIFKHNDGKRTETQKMGGSSKISEWVYDRNNILCGGRLFSLNEKGQITSGVIYDGKKHPVGSTINTFDPQTGQMMKEELKNAQGQLIRILYYPGALKDPRFSKRMVAFNLDPNNKAAPPRQVTGTVRPIVPVTKDEDEFEPGLPPGRGAPTLQEAAPSRERPTPSKTAPRSWLPGRKR
jgi:hypothetical protein